MIRALNIDNNTAATVIVVVNGCHVSVPAELKVRIDILAQESKQ